MLSYGDVAGVLGRGGPRQVGHVLSRRGGGVPWWRVTHADGSPAPGHEVTAGLEWVAERTPLRAGTDLPRADMARARWTGPFPVAGNESRVTGPARGTP